MAGALSPVDNAPCVSILMDQGPAVADVTIGDYLLDAAGVSMRWFEVTCGKNRAGTRGNHSTEHRASLQRATG